MRKPQRIRTAEGGISDDEQVLDAILTRTTDAGSTVYVIIYPYHAEIWLMIERLCFGELFSEWKKIIVAIRRASR